MLIMQQLRVLPSLLPTLACVLLTGLSGAPPAAAAARAATGAVAAAPSRDLAGVRAAERMRAHAVASRDVAALRGLISGDYYHVETNGRVRTKTEFLQLLERDAYEFRTYEVTNAEIRLFDSGRIAVVVGRLNAELQQPGRGPDFRGRYVRMWQWTPDGWRNTMHQSTEIRTVTQQRDARPLP